MASFKDFDEKTSFEDVKAKVIGTRKKLAAILCSCDEWDEDQWVPLSQIDDSSEVRREGDEGTLVVSEWWAREVGLI